MTTEKNACRLLIGTERPRAENNYTLDGDADQDGIYRGAAGPATSVVGRGEAARVRAVLRGTMEKGDTIEHYGNQSFLIQLRLFVEVYGRERGGQSGKFMRHAMIVAESGSAGRMEAQLFSLSR